jgi:YidC/Oxa1 family membrane protein insertase
VYGAFIILQQRIVPQQAGMDPAQQKLMMYGMPVIFTVLVLFLPAALGVYMLTSSALGIAQQLVMEKIAPRDGGPKGGIGVKVETGVGGSGSSKKNDGGARKAPAFGKGEARV